MKYFFIPVFLLAQGIALPLKAEDKKADKDPVTAIINGKELKKSEISAEMKGVDLKDIPKDKAFNLIRDRMIDIILLSQAAQKADLEKSPKIQEALEKIKERLLLQTFVEENIKGKVTEQDIQKALKEISPPLKELALSHIVVADATKANGVIKALKNGDDFASLAKKHSIDTKTSANGGALGVILEAELSSPLREAISELKAGGFTEKAIETPSGFHILKLESRRDASLQTAASFLGEELKKKALLNFIAEERKKGKITTFD